MTPPRFSLVLATLGRTTELSRFLRSLVGQTMTSHELIVVDQNPDDRLRSVIADDLDRLRIVHLRSAIGLSRSRNVGLEHASGQFVGFPDDDCWYPLTLLESIAALQHRTGADALTFRVVDEKGMNIARFDKQEGLVDRYNVWRRVSSVSIFVRTEVARAVGGFDETLGLGSGTRWTSAEDFDFPIRILETQARIYYTPRLTAIHPRALDLGYAESIRRAKRYAPGFGRVLRKHRYPFWFVAHSLLRPLGGMLLGGLTLRWHKARYHFEVFRGRLAGWRSA